MLCREAGLAAREAIGRLDVAHVGPRPTTETNSLLPWSQNRLARGPRLVRSEGPFLSSAECIICDARTISPARARAVVLGATMAVKVSQARGTSRPQGPVRVQPRHPRNPSGRSPPGQADAGLVTLAGHRLEPIDPQVHPHALERGLDRGGKAGLPGSRSPVEDDDLAGWPYPQQSVSFFSRAMQIIPDG